jgi:hypothetical protein
MEKLILVLILNSPDQTATLSRFDIGPQDSCFAMAEKVNNSPSNRIVYSDELDDVKERFAFCEYANGQRIAIPATKPKRS